MTKRWLGIGVVAVLCAGVAWAFPRESAATDPLQELARNAVGGDEATRAEAIAALRAEGPTGHAVLLRMHEAGLTRLRRGERFEGSAELRQAIDTVSGQRDGHASGLYWHTDLDTARREAERTGRPILSLRLLGRLDEEMSCANSRYFRLVLYSDPDVAERLRQQYVLHWSTERPAPRITIDMGDGRVIERTITGNSVHYVLDAEGRVRDAIVGLYAPQQFLAALDTSNEAARCEDQACVMRVHNRAGEALERRWRERGQPWEQALASLPDAPPSAAPDAVIAMPLTISKARIEMPMLEAMGDEAPAPEEPDWTAVANALSTPRSTSDRARGLLRLKLGRDDVASVADALREAARADGVRNEVLFRQRLHRWFSEGWGRDFSALNRRVYSELLLTPESDPWLGLQEDGLYDGIEAQ